MSACYVCGNTYPVRGCDLTIDGRSRRVCAHCAIRYTARCPGCGQEADHVSLRDDANGHDRLAATLVVCRCAAP